MNNQLQIGNVKLTSRVVLAPMAGVTNSAFKEVCREVFEGLICSEMVNDKGILHKNEKTRKMTHVSEVEHPVSMQLFGNNVETMVEAAKYLDTQTNCDIIDINMGCPAPKITKNDSGSKLLLYPEKAYEIVSEIKKNINKPLTVKMRIGYDEKRINAVEFAKLMQKAGADAIFVHGRTTSQQYKGRANWEVIKKVKEVVDIPVIGNGDIDSPQKAKEMIEYSNVDGVMVGRAAMGNPWLLKEIDEYLKTGKISKPVTIKEKQKALMNHLEKLEKIKTTRVAILEIRGQACWYFKSIKNANKIKREFQKVSTKEELERVFDMIDKQEAKKVFFFDVDGTLLPHGDNEKISVETLYALDQLQRNGHDVILATGKSKQMLAPVLKDTNFKTYITCNGAVVHKDEKVVFNKPFDEEALQKAIKFSKENGLMLGCQTDNKYYLLDFNIKPSELDKCFGTVNLKVPEVMGIDNDEIYQTWFIGDIKDIDMSKEIVPGYTQFVWATNAADCIAKDINKNTAIEYYLQNHYDEKPVRYCFGDGQNDTAMIKNADFGIVMGNAKDELKKHAHEVIKTCQENGVYEYLVKEKFIKPMIKE